MGEVVSKFDDVGPATTDTPPTFRVRVLADSVNPSGVRLSTLECEYPRFIHSELMTHRVFSRNASSSRAVPVRKTLDRVRWHPVTPIHFGSEKPGMAAGQQVDDVARAIETWQQASRQAWYYAAALSSQGVHKSLCNRLLEPFLTITTVVSSTDWAHFFKLRCHEAAEVHFQHLAAMMREALEGSQPEPLGPGDWHLPYIRPEDRAELGDNLKLAQVSAARCARVSYLTHDGRRAIGDDLDLFGRLVGPEHWSPLEHPAECRSDDRRDQSNFRGWTQLRKLFVGKEFKVG
jgi:hypothetical protein